MRLVLREARASRVAKRYARKSILKIIMKSSPLILGDRGLVLVLK